MRADMTPPAVSILREGEDIEQKQTLGLLRLVTGQDGSWMAAPVSNNLIGADTLVGLLAVEEVRHELDDTGDTGERFCELWTCQSPSHGAVQDMYQQGYRLS